MWSMPSAPSRHKLAARAWLSVCGTFAALGLCVRAAAGPDASLIDGAVPDGAASGGVASGGAGAGVPSSASGSPAAPLRVGVAGSEPFVVTRDGGPDGLSVEVWREAARAAELEYELRRVSSVDAALKHVADGQLDVAVGPISITADRAEHVRFTQPYFQSSLAILAPSRGDGLLARVAPFLSRAFLVGTGTLLLVLLGVGALLWATERRKNSEMFDSAPVKGIGTGVWLALVTMTTVGYGDRVPVTLAGRVVAGVWMVIAMLTISSLTAGIATALTVSSLDHSAISRASQLAGRRVAVLPGTVGARFARAHGARLVPEKNVEAAIGAVKNGRAEAMVHDRPILQYLLSRGTAPGLALSETVYRPRGYGFAVRSDEAELHQRLSVALLRTAEDGSVERIADHWLGGDE